METYLITSNRNKLREAEQILGIPLKTIELDLVEIQELDAEKIAEHKVLEGWKHVGRPLFTWDVSLYIHCLNGFPGPLIKWFWKQVTLEKICNIVNMFDDHGIEAKTILVYYDGKVMKHFSGSIQGTIPSEPRGAKGFAWDSIFIPEGHSRTFAEMNPEDKNAISMHKIALEKFREYMRNCIS